MLDDEGIEDVNINTTPLDTSQDVTNNSEPLEINQEVTSNAIPPQVNAEDDILIHFQEVTGRTEVEECMRLLDAANWNLEQAVQLSFSEIASPTNPPTIPIEQNLEQVEQVPAPVPAFNAFGNINEIPLTTSENFNSNMRQRLITTYNNPANPNFIGPRLNNSTGPVINRNNQSTVQIIYSSFWNILYWPIRTAYSIFWTVVQFALRFFFAPGPPTQRQAGQEVEKYISEFDSRYGIIHPRFYHGSYREAVSHAKRHLRFLLVYLHHEDNPVAVRFAKNVVCTGLLKSVVEDNLLFWSCSTKKGEGECVAESLNKAKPPFLGLLCFKDGQMRMVYKNQGYATIEMIISRLTTAIVENEPHLNRQRSNRDRVSESSASQQIMQEQDAAFQESLVRDQERARKKKEEEDAIKKIQEEEERVKREKEEKIAAREALRKKLKLSLTEQTKEETICLLFRLPSGSRVSRKFSPESKIQDIYEFAMTCDESPNFFTLVSNFPKRVLPYDGDAYLKSCNEMGIQNSTTLFVQEMDSDDEGTSSESEAEL